MDGIDKEELLKYSKNESFGLKGKEKIKEILESIQNEPIILEGEEKEKIIEYIKNESFGLNGKEKEKEILESIQNEPIILNGKEKENDNLEYMKNDSIIFTGKEKEKEIPEQDNLNKEFNKDTLELCHSENLAVIIKEDYERKEEEEKNKNLKKDIQNENATPNLVESVERIEITGKEKDNENEGEEEESDENENKYPTGKKTKQIINNMVQDKLKKEKEKNMEKTKENVIKVFKVIKLKNALGKNLKNKRYFIEKLKELKNINDKKNILCPVTAITHDFISKKNRKKEKGTDVDDLDETNKEVNKKDDKPLDIDNNNQILNQKNYKTVYNQNRIQENLIDKKTGKRKMGKTFYNGAEKSRYRIPYINKVVYGENNLYDPFEKLQKDLFFEVKNQLKNAELINKKKKKKVVSVVGIDILRKLIREDSDDEMKKELFELNNNQSKNNNSSTNKNKNKSNKTNKKRNYFPIRRKTNYPQRKNYNKRRI